MAISTPCRMPCQCYTNSSHHVVMTKENELTGLKPISVNNSPVTREKESAHAKHVSTNYLYLARSAHNTRFEKRIEVNVYILLYVLKNVL